MRALVLVLALVLPALAAAQSRTVQPDELALSVTVEDTGATPLEREMVLITIRGVYRRHITLENLVQPDLAGFSWAQLGPDQWRDERLDGQKVKIFERRMALYPDTAGPLIIGAFRHDLTLTDEGDDWFEHAVHSVPVQITVAPAPVQPGWWFPVRALKVSDQWSNAPDQLQPGEGVLRVIRLEALGVTPEMIPPMPELTSPSGMIFAHPEKRLVDLTPEGPMTYAFWRWTIRPSNDVSTIVEPLEFEYFDTRARVARTVTISAQRVAYGAVVPGGPAPGDSAGQVASAAAPAALPGPWMLLAGGIICALGCAATLWGRRFAGLPRLMDRFAWRLRFAGFRGDLPALRRVATAILRRDGPDPARQRLLMGLDSALFNPHATPFDHKAFVRKFLTAHSLAI